MKQKIKAIGFFHTPENMAELEATAERYSGGERTGFVMGMCLAWNLAAKITAENEALTVEEEVKQIMDDCAEEIGAPAQGEQSR